MSRSKPQLSCLVANGRLSVTHSHFPNHDEWLGFIINKTSLEVLQLVIEAASENDVREVMNLWDGAVINY
jgi:hypothetical protein